MGTKVFEVTAIDCCLRDNGKKHHTDDYRRNFVVRRGGAFDINIHQNGYDENSHTFFFRLKTGKNPTKKNGTLVEIQQEEQQDDDCSFQITSKTDKCISVSVFIPVHTLVSSYTMELVTVCEENGRMKKKGYPVDNILYIIFNPWHEKDEVYMEDEDMKNEYVLNDSGWIYWGGHKPKPWNFAQFTDAALKCTFKILESAYRVNMRDSAREVARYISSMANSCDNNGLLVGNWSGDYGRETKPWQWAGSQAIFKKYNETGESVKYGQCWVFSGVTTSMMRCLGIPCRSVTNYDSAHDADGNCTNDKYFDENLDYLEDESYDSVWNFHVWNDAWMERPDLPAGMGGWQAIDGTPQERSKGVFRCGPASLQAIKEGNINLPYDARFVFAEVNADTVYWQKTSDGEVKPIRVKPNSVGSAVLTKKANAFKMEDVTDQYKHKEGSILERAVVRNVMKKVKNPVIEDQPKDIAFSTKVPWNLNPDGDLTVKLSANNKKFQTLTVNAAVVAHVVRYNGVKLKSLEKRTSEKVVNSREDESFKFKFESSEFEEFLDENISIRFSFMAKVKETNQSFVTQKVCNIQKPELKLELIDNEDGKVRNGDTMKVKIHIPKLNGVKKFSNSTLMVESSVIDNVILELKDTEANSHSGYIEKSFEVEYYGRDKQTDFNVTFNATEISGIHGTMEISAVAPDIKDCGC